MILEILSRDHPSNLSLISREGCTTDGRLFRESQTLNNFLVVDCKIGFVNLNDMADNSAFTVYTKISTNPFDV